MAKKNTPAVDPLVASLMPESDKKMGAIAGISLVVALAICLWASMYEQVVDEVVFDDSAAADLTASMTIDEKKEEKKEEKKKEEPKKPRKKAGGGGKPRGKGQPNAPQTRGVLKLLTAQTKNASAGAYDLMKNQKFSKDIDKVLKDVAENPEQNKDGSYFMQSVKASFYNDDIQVYTPEGKAILLPKSSTAIDFAFNIHTEVGMHAKYAKINGHLASIKTKLKRGDSVEIGTAPEVWPGDDWPQHARSYKALKHIHLYLDRKARPKYLRCPYCNPIPGEEVIGFNNDNGSITVHRRDCSEAIGLASRYGDSIVAVDYQTDSDVLYPATVTLKAVDRQHLLSDIIDSISNKLHLSINDLHTVTEDEIVTTTINFFVHDYMELRTVVSSILSIPDVDEVSYLNK